ncbi:MAG: hypothetical protein ABW184_08560 [Sphingobium sp.]
MMDEKDEPKPAPVTDVDEEKVDSESEDIQRKAERDANPLAPPVNTRAS